MRIDKYLSNLKYGSRSEVRTFIKNGLVKINNKVINDSHFKIDPNKDLIHFDNEEIIYFDELNIMLNKPCGYLSANKDDLHKVAIDLIKEPYNRYDLKIAGRLDLNSSGILLLTTNGKLAHILTSPNSKIDKEYEVVIDKSINNYNDLLKGVIIKDGKNNDYLAKALKINKINDKTFHIVINEGKFHQVRRMFLYLGANVLKLKRVRYGNLTLGDLKEGEYKLFKREDVL